MVCNGENSSANNSRLMLPLLRTRGASGVCY